MDTSSSGRNSTKDLRHLHCEAQSSGHDVENNKEIVSKEECTFKPGNDKHCAISPS